jgi:integrase
MSVHFDAARQRFVVRWNEGGKRRCRRFRTELEATAFDAQVNTVAATHDEFASEPLPPTRHDGIYPYSTKKGVRWRFVFRQSDGTMSSRRGFTSPRAAARARERLNESIRRGEVKVARKSFADFWELVLAQKRRYVTAGSYEDFATHGRKRLLPFFGSVNVSAIDEDLVRDWLGTMSELVEEGELAPKTVNNARTCLSVALKEAYRRGLVPRNPCEAVPPLPAHRQELDYLRMAEIEPYLEACSQSYRPLAEFLIGTGARVSETVAVRLGDLELSNRVVRIYRQRGRQGLTTSQTKGKRFRSVHIGPRLVDTLKSHVASHGTPPTADWLFLCPPPKRGRYSKRTDPVPPHRKTVLDWHKAALKDAGLRDMPLHALRHTAAAAWLISGHPLFFVQRQLGHRSITTTEEHYGHLEASFMRDAAARTEAAITSARALVPPEPDQDTPSGG